MTLRILQQLHSDLWIADAPLRFLGLEVGTRMTVVRLPGDELFLHSPVPISSELRKEVETLGRVAHIVAPNRLHHLFIGEWIDAFPDARVYAAPGLSRKRKDLRIDGTLTSEAPPEWKDALDQVAVEGFPFANEVVFFHRASKTVIATDLAFKIGPCSPPTTRFAFHLFRTYGRLSPTILERLLIRDREAFRRSLETILAWPFERVIVAHGEVATAGAREELTEGYGWILSA